MSLVVTEKHGL